MVFTVEAVVNLHYEGTRRCRERGLCVRRLRRDQLEFGQPVKGWI